VITHPGLPQTRTCRTTASGSSSQGFTTCGDVPTRTRVGKVPGASPISLSVSITVTRQRMSGIRGGSCRRIHDLTPRFPPAGPLGQVPRLQRYYQGATTSCRPSRRTSLPSLGHTTGTLAISLPAPPSVVTLDLGLITRYPRPGLLPWRRQDLPRSWGTPSVLLPCSSTPAGPSCQAFATRRRGPRYVHDEGSRIGTFEAQSHGFGTGCLRFAGWVTPPPRKTRFRLLAKLCRTGFPPAGFLQKVSNSHHVCYPPLPSFRGARTFYFSVHK